MRGKLAFYLWVLLQQFLRWIDRPYTFTQALQLYYVLVGPNLGLFLIGFRLFFFEIKPRRQDPGLGGGVLFFLHSNFSTIFF